VAAKSATNSNDYSVTPKNIEKPRTNTQRNLYRIPLD
jgi:hypothetical protein